MDPTPRPPPARPALPPLLALALLPLVPVRSAPTQDQRPPDTGARVQALVAELDDPGTFDRIVAELAALGESAVPFLVGYLDPENAPYVSADVALVLGRMGERGTGAIDALLEAFGEARSPQLRDRLAWAIGEVGPWAGAREAALRQLQAAGQWSFRHRIAIERLRLGPRPSRWSLRDALGGEPWARVAAAQVLASGHPAGEELLPELVQALPGKSRGSRAPVAPRLVTELHVAFAEAVVAVAPGSGEALEASAYLLRHDDPQVRALAMARISVNAPSEVPWLTWWDHALRDPSPRVVREALVGTDRHGDLSLLLVPRLWSLTESPYREVRWLADHRLDAVLEQLSPLGRRMYELTTCPQRELREREEELARELLDSEDETAIVTLQAMPLFFADYLGNDEVEKSARRALGHMHRLAGK